MGESPRWHTLDACLIGLGTFLCLMWGAYRDWPSGVSFWLVALISYVLGRHVVNEH